MTKLLEHLARKETRKEAIRALTRRNFELEKINRDDPEIQANKQRIELIRSMK